jgi:diaminopimelate epimerase
MKKFYKMHGLGNDFVIFDLREIKVEFNTENIKKICNRKLGIGCDQLIIIEKDPQADCFMRIFNKDGSEVESCGNATRCVARLLQEENKQSSYKINTIGGLLKAEKISQTDYAVNIGKAKTGYNEIPISKKIETSKIDFNDELLGKAFAVNVGNPHIVFIVRALDQINLKKHVAKYENNILFPERVNVNVIEIINKHEINLKVWERGAGETMACGTGACASFFAAYQQKLVNNNVKIKQPGGSLNITINSSKEIIMTGPTHLSFIGETQLI